MNHQPILDRIVTAKRVEIAAAKRAVPPAALEAAVGKAPPARDFLGALRGGKGAVIAEVKKASPSRGIIREDFHPRKIAAAYEANGAAAISVLTERKFFRGDERYLKEIGGVVSLPLLRKDFIIDPYQIYETRRLGGDAVLLIARLLNRGETLAEFIALTLNLGLTPLVEVHDEAELEKALGAGAPVIGVNNRNLDTFVTDLGTSRRLAPLIPPGIVKVSESGIDSRRDVELLVQAGFDALLVGETLMRARDPGAKLRELTGGKDGEAAATATGAAPPEKKEK